MAQLSFSRKKHNLEKFTVFTSFEKIVRTRQQVSRAFVSVNEQTYNRRHSAIDEVEEQARQLFNVEHKVDTMRAAI